MPETETALNLSKICSDQTDCEKQKQNTQEIIDSSVSCTKTNNNPGRICFSINISCQMNIK